MRNIIKRILKEETDYLPQDHKIIKIIKKIIGNEFEGYFYDYRFPGDNDSDRISYKINFHLSKANIWKVTDEHRENVIYWGGKPIYEPKEGFQYEGTLYIKLDYVEKKLESTGETEQVYDEDELDSVAWGDFTENIVDQINKLMSVVYVDVDLSF